MASRNVRISETALRTLRELAEVADISMQTMLDRVIEDYRREAFLKRANDAFAALRANPERWKEELEERRLWDKTLKDGAEQ